MKKIPLLLLLAALAPAADILTVDPTGQVVVSGTAPTIPASTEVRIGAGNILIGRATAASAQEAVRGDDPRLSDARPANGGNAATVGGLSASSFVQTASVGAANGVASLDSSGKIPAQQLPPATGSTMLFVQTADSAQTDGNGNFISVMGTGIGSTTIPANYFVAGKMLRVRLGTRITRLSVGGFSGPTMSLGGVVVASVTPPPASSGAAFFVELTITCRSAGTSGSFLVQGLCIPYGTSSTLPIKTTTPTGFTINTTVANAFDVTMATSSNTLAVSEMFAVEALN
jgi:hypothetical protein